MKTLCRSVAMVLLSLLCSAALAEGLLRVFLPQELVSLHGTDIWQPDDTLGWRTKENLDLVVNTGEGPVRFVTDHKGRRVAPRADATSTEPAIRILAVGDSFLEALGVNYEAALPVRLRQSIAARIGEPVEVTTVAASGWDPYQYLAAVRVELGQQRYDLGVVFLYTGNDIVGPAMAANAPRHRGLTRRPRWPGSWSKSEWRAALLRPGNDFLEAKSHLFVFLKTRMGRLLARWGLTAAYFPDVFEKSFAAAPPWLATVAVCYRIRQEFARNRTPVLFVLLPCSYQVHAAVFEDYVAAFGIDRGQVDLEQPNRILGQVFQQASLTLLDPLPSLRVEAEGNQLLFGKVDRHLNTAGHDAVGRFVGDAAAPLLKSALSHKSVPAQAN